MDSDLTVFLRQMLRNPFQTSALAPSSPGLARAMTAHIGPKTGHVAEFGPGTGPLTTAILARGVPQANLTLFELNADFAESLRQRFPATTLFETGAQEAARLCTSDFGAVVSGLPLLSMPKALRRAIVAAAFGILRPGGVMTQFTYGPNPPLTDAGLDALGLTCVPGARIWRNIPPARVYFLRRRGE